MFLGSKARRILGVELDPSFRGVVKDYKRGLPVAQVAERNFWSESAVRRIVREARVDIRPPGRPRVDRELVLEKFKMGEEAGLSRTGAIRFAARVGGFSESTVWRALEEE